MPILVGVSHFGHDLLDILVCSFYCPIHLWTVWCKIVMFDLELLTYLVHHFVVQIGSIIRNDPFWNPISAYDLFLDELADHRSSDTCI